MASAAQPNAAEITPDVAAFLNRALPHFLAGMSIADSMRAVLDDDARLAGAFFTRSGSHYYPTADERGASCSTRETPGDLIASELSSCVYQALRVTAA